MHPLYLHTPFKAQHKLKAPKAGLASPAGNGCVLPQIHRSASKSHPLTPYWFWTRYFGTEALPPPPTHPHPTRQQHASTHLQEVAACCLKFVSQQPEVLEHLPLMRKGAARSQRGPAHLQDKSAHPCNNEQAVEWRQGADCLSVSPAAAVEPMHACMHVRGHLMSMYHWHMLSW